MILTNTKDKEQPTGLTTTKNNKNIARADVSEAIANTWYYADMSVTCLPLSYIRSSTDEEYYIQDNGLTLSPNYYVNWRELYAMNPAETDRVIEESLQECLECNCAPNQEGDHHPRFGASFALSTNPDSEGCQDELTVAKCRVLFGCVCYEFVSGKWGQERGALGRLHEKQKGSGSTYLKGPPGSQMREKPLERYIRKNPRVASERTYQEMLDDLGITFANHRKLVPGTNEPYYVEGPNVNIGPNWNFLNTLSSFARASRFSKRDDQEETSHKQESSGSEEEK
ncbi:hypothetical protein AA313_de0204242 [Arthrobotrys entomopaga]|nr:hypothetical protein AA313_de0204242 [Arthrobotrys entomopaga]